MRRLAIIAAILLVSLPALSEEFVDWEMVGRLREEGFRNSQVEEILLQLTDGIGPRITNSPQMREASRWTRDKFAEWGLSECQLYPFEFGAGWSFESCSVKMLAPAKMSLEALPLAWTPGTDGPIRGHVVKLVVEDEEEFDEWLEENQDVDLAGAILFLDDSRAVELDDSESFHRHDVESLAELCSYEIPSDSGRGPSPWRKRAMKRLKLRKRMFEYAQEQGVVAFVDISSRDHGVVRATSGGDMELERRVPFPGFALSAEHYNRVLRDLKNGDVELEFDIVASFHDGDINAENTLAEIPGHAKKRELVMAGAHLDSWHGATGTTDNAAGCAVVMEAARILQAIGVEMDRTVRFALWSGEEQGLLGSEAYVDQTFVERPPVTDEEQLSLPRRYREATWPLTVLPEHDRFSAYFNLDNGSGKIRGIYTQENAGVIPIFRAWLEPFHDLGAQDVAIRNTGGTDHQSFDRVGLPGFQFIQDRLSYFPRTHHSNLDLFDNASIDDLKQASVIMASFIYHAATRPERLPRKPMPEPPPEEPKPESEKPEVAASGSSR